MSLGDVSVTVETGGAQQRTSSALAAKTIVQLGVSPKGTVNALYRLSSLAGITDAFDTGPLAEACALRHRSGLTAYAVPVNPSVDGDTGAVAQVGTGTGTVAVSVAPHRVIDVLCSTAGALGTAAFRFRVGGSSSSYGAPVTSVAGASWTYLVPGTFCKLTFDAAAYVDTKTCNVAVNGTVTPGAGWVGTVTQASSPIDNYDAVCTVQKAGALGVAVLRISLDGNKTTIPDTMVPTGGVVVIPGTGLVLTCANTFVANDTYSFLAHPPNYGTSDETAALNALRAEANAPTVALIHNTRLPFSAATAITAATTLDTAIDTALDTNKLDWQGLSECPASGDTIVSGGAAVADSADTDTVIRAAREGQTFDRVAVCVGTHRMTSVLTSYQLKRPLGWAIASRYADTEPRQDVSWRALGSLGITAIGRDERTATNSLHDAQFNVVQTIAGMPGVYLAIESGGFGFRNMTTDASYQDAVGVRVLNILVAALRVAAQKYVGSRQATNADGTIAETAARRIDTDLDGEAKRGVGLKRGGDFAEPQASLATASVSRSSQLGSSPRRLDVEYQLQPLGFVSAVSARVRFSGVISVEE